MQVKSAGEVSKVFRGLYDMEIKEVSIKKVESSQIDSLRKDVRIAAIKAAKDKAEYLLAAIGEQIDNPLEVREEQQLPYIDNVQISNMTYKPYNVRKRESLNENDEKNDESKFENIVIRFSYYIKYAIK